jgi:Protein of unknown function (DUF3179)
MRTHGLRKAMVAVALCAAGALLSMQPAQAQTPKPKTRLPYVTINHPQFVPASHASFLGPQDLVIGVTYGKIAKAYPAGILAQHGVALDRMPDGPIAATW